jgi:cystathionine beta-lyase
MSSEKKIATRLAHMGRDPKSHAGTVNPPIVRASTILQPDLVAWEESYKPGYTGLRYGLLGTPTSRAFEGAMAELYGVEHCVAVSSGLAAITIPILAMTKAGDHVLMTDNIYFPAREFATRVLTKFGVTVTYYDPAEAANLEGHFRPETSLVVTEQPGSLTFEMQDIPALVATAHAHGAKVMIDNTWATALLYDPFRHGVDVVIEATTKYVGGHADVLGGAVLANGALGKQIFTMAKTLGDCCGPEELYLALRGLRTLALRLERSAQTGLTLAHWLATRPEVDRLIHPALEGDAGHAIWQRDFRGTSGLFAFILKPVARPALEAFFRGFELFGIGASWGGFESLIIHSVPLRTVVPWRETGHLIRIHAGTEDPGDLIADLEAAFARLAAAG